MKDLIHKKKKHAKTRGVFLVENTCSQQTMIMMVAFVLLLVMVIARPELEENST